MTQQIQEIDIADLVLWTENPRDPIDPHALDQDIAERAWKDEQEKWSLLSLAKKMRKHYDLSELPTIVYHDEKPVVYDGNRRMLLAKIKLNYVFISDFDITKLPEVPNRIPCNVCSKEVAIQNVYRKHGDSGTWTPLDRDTFIYKFMNGAKSTFLKLNETTGIISSNSNLNKVFVKNEIFNNEKLKDLGFDFINDELYSKHTSEEAFSILNDISNKVSFQEIGTRKNRGKVFEILEKGNRVVIERNKSNEFNKITLKRNSQIQRLVMNHSLPTKNNTYELFYSKLDLKTGQVSNIYHDIVGLYDCYKINKKRLSQNFPSLVRMSMRILIETAATDKDMSIEKYLKSYFNKAMLNLDTEARNVLFLQNINENTIIQLLHIGANNYTAANNIEQTIAISFILGKIIEITHGK